MRIKSLRGFGAIQFISYTVQAGDTLSGIANQFGVDMNTIAAQNMITDPNVITVGQQLDIPMEDTQFNAYYNSIATSPAEFTPAQIASTHASISQAVANASAPVASTAPTNIGQLLLIAAMLYFGYELVTN
jgi:LysM repeat protein